VRELGRHLVIKAERAGLHLLVVLQAERQQHGLLDPLVHRPLAHAFARGNAQLAVVELGNHVLDGVTHFGRGGAGRDVGAVFPRGVDDLLQLLGHGESLG
jgi:hypothetical protein